MKEINLDLSITFDSYGGIEELKPVMIILPDRDEDILYTFKEVRIPMSEEEFNHIYDIDSTDILYYISYNISFKDSDGNLVMNLGFDIGTIKESSDEHMLCENFKVFVPKIKK